MPKDQSQDKPQRRDETREKQPYRGPAPQTPGQPATRETELPRSHNSSSDSGGMGGGNR